jgi:hypothetical protein
MIYEQNININNDYSLNLYYDKNSKTIDQNLNLQESNNILINILFDLFVCLIFLLNIFLYIIQQKILNQICHQLNIDIEELVKKNKQFAQYIEDIEENIKKIEQKIKHKHTDNVFISLELQQTINFYKENIIQNNINNNNIYICINNNYGLLNLLYINPLDNNNHSIIIEKYGKKLQELLSDVTIIQQYENELEKMKQIINKINEKEMDMITTKTKNDEYMESLEKYIEYIIEYYYNNIHNNNNDEKQQIFQEILRSGCIDYTTLRTNHRNIYDDIYSKANIECFGIFEQEDINTITTFFQSPRNGCVKGGFIKGQDSTRKYPAVYVYWLIKPIIDICLEINDNNTDKYIKVINSLTKLWIFSKNYKINCMNNKDETIQLLEKLFDTNFSNAGTLFLW